MQSTSLIARPYLKSDVTPQFHEESKVDARQIELPMYKTVIDKIGNPIVNNICALGALLSLIH